MTLTSALSLCVVAFCLMATTRFGVVDGCSYCGLPDVCKTITCGVKGPTCSLRGDPHFSSFTKSIRSFLSYPCLALLAHLKYSAAGGDVHVKVYASSGLTTIKGRYFLDFVRVVVFDDTLSFERVYENNDTNIIGSLPPIWEETGDPLPAHVHVLPTYDDGEMLSRLLIGETGSEEFNVAVKFYPRTEIQPDHRGLKIKVQKGSNTSSLLYFPDSLGSMLDDFSGTSAINCSFTNDTKVFLAAIGQGGPQDNDVCQSASETYMKCGSTQKTAAAYCKRYLDHKKAKCLEDPSTGGQGGDAMVAFDRCLRYMCGFDVDDGCDHCELGPLCDSSECKSLPDLNCDSDDDCLDGAICLSGVCSLVADISESCLGCHRVCGSGSTCDDTEHVCISPAVSCDPLTLMSGNVTCNAGFVYPSVCSFSCDTGYELMGSDNTTCQENRSWSNTPPTCDPVTCPGLANGDMMCSNGTMAGSTCSFSCFHFYRLLGPSSATCQSNGTWAPARTFCEILPEWSCATRPCSFIDSKPCQCNDGCSTLMNCCADYSSVCA